MNESQECFGTGAQCTHTPPLLYIITPPPQRLLPLTHELSTRSGQVAIGPSGANSPCVL